MLHLMKQIRKKIFQAKKKNSPTFVGFFVYRHLGLVARTLLRYFLIFRLVGCTFTLLCNNSYPKEGAGRKWQGSVTHPVF